MRLFLLTLGTRGDVQPFVALGVGLMRRGHEVTVCTSAGFRPFIEGHGLRYGYLNNDILDLVDSETGRRAMQRGGGAIGMARWMVEAARLFRPIFRKTLAEQWEAARGAEAIVYHPQAVGGSHIAEALGVPGIMADPLPTWVPTGAFPNVVVPDPGLGAGFNRLTYGAISASMRAMYGSVVSRWRREVLGLPAGPFSVGATTRADGRPVPTLLGFSPSVIPPPTDWPAHVEATGYWFLDEGRCWEPPAGLAEFLGAGPPPVFVGFGSMAGRDPSGTARLVVEALGRAGARGVIVTGWGGLAAEGAPEGVYVASSAPYDWLMTRVAAVVHHGGAGTTAEGLRAGKPTVICPFVADQPFWGRRVAKLGAGPRPIPQRRLTAEGLAAAIRAALDDPEMARKAAALGEAIRAEDGVGRAVAAIEREAA